MATAGALSTKLSASGNTPETHGMSKGIRSSPGSAVNPYFRACSASASAPSSRPTSPKVTLHDCCNAEASVICAAPPEQCVPPKFWIVASVSGKSSSCGFGHVLSGPNPFSSAADAVTILNVEPGGNSSSLARETSGLSGSSFSSSHAARTTFGSCEASWFGSYVGSAYKASTLPVVGSTAAMATSPDSASAAWIAASWSSGSRVVTIVAPRLSRPRTRSASVCGKHLDEVDLREQQQEQHEQTDAQAPDLPLHVRSPPVRARDRSRSARAARAG